jgi:ABC-type lipoprotein export system ATPase subunit
MKMHLIELSNYSLAPTGSGNGLDGFYLVLSKGDIYSIQADLIDDAHNLLRALATLTLPIQGRYLFMGEKLDFSDYRKLLRYKKKIGYIASDSAMISNRTIRENLLLKRNYFENSLSIDLDENTANLCRLFNIEKELDIRPAALNPLDLRLAITIRELTKPPEILLLNRPEDFVGQTKFDLFTDIFKDLLVSEMPVVLLSYHIAFIEQFATKKILITDGNLTIVPI